MVFTPILAQPLQVNEHYLPKNTINGPLDSIPGIAITGAADEFPTDRASNRHMVWWAIPWVPESRNLLLRRDAVLSFAANTSEQPCSTDDGRFMQQLVPGEELLEVKRSILLCAIMPFRAEPALPSVRGAHCTVRLLAVPCHRGQRLKRRCPPASVPLIDKVWHSPSGRGSRGW